MPAGTLSRCRAASPNCRVAGRSPHCRSTCVTSRRRQTRWAASTESPTLPITPFMNARTLFPGGRVMSTAEVNNAMLRNTVEPVLANADNFQHISIQQGTKYYGVHLHPIPIPPRESDPRHAHENFFHDQEDYVAQMGAKRGFRYTALRPQLVTGSTPGTLNVLPAIGAYGAIRRELGEPFGFPGGPSFVWEAADADLVADVMVWSAESLNAANQAFNVTNGDVFEWRSVWPAIAAALGVQAASDTPLSLAEYLSDKGEVWRRVAERHGLRHSDLHTLTGYGDQHADFAFAYGAPAGPRAFVSTVKLRQAGYTKVIDTQQAF